MGEKTVAMLSEDDGLFDVCSRINQRRKFADKRMLDMQKKLKEEMEKLQKENSDDWSSLTEWLRSKGRLPDDFNDQTHSISFNIKSNSVKIAKQGDEEDLPNLPPGIMGKPMSIDEMPPEMKQSLIKFLESHPVPPSDE